jgi:hypothetical protein
LPPYCLRGIGWILSLPRLNPPDATLTPGVVRAGPAEGPDGVARSPYASVVVVAGTMAIAIAWVYWMMRGGFANPIAAIVNAVGLSLFLTTFPYATLAVLRRVKGDPASDGSWLSSYPFLWLVGLGLSSIVGRFVPALAFELHPLFTICGVVAFVLVLAQWLRRDSWWRSLLVLAGSFGLGVWAAGVVWGRIYKSPLFLEMLAANGVVHHDSLHLAAFANMLRTYHVPTIGVDGLSRVSYHWGTAWMFAQWSRLTDTDVLSFYQLGFPVTMIPFFAGGLLAFGIAIGELRGKWAGDLDPRRNWIALLVLVIGMIGIIPLSGLDAMGVWTSNFLISESYTVAVPVFLLLSATAVAFHRRRGATPERPADFVFPLVILPLSVALLGYLKISLMFLAVCAFVYAVIRLRNYRRPIYLAGVLLAIFLAALAYPRLSLPAHREGFAAFDFIRGYVPTGWWPVFFIVHLAWTWIYILVRVRQETIDTFAEMREALRDRRLIDVELLLVVAIAGLGPGLLLRIDGGSAFYFSDVQRWLSIGLLISVAPVVSLRRVMFRGGSSLRVGPSVVGFLALAGAIILVGNALVWPIRMARANVETRRALYPSEVAATIPPGLHGFLHVRDPATLQAALRASNRARVAEGLRRLATLPEAERRRTALFIPQSETAYWEILARPGACTFTPLVAPALASMAMIDGMPPFGCVVSRYYGLGSFQPRTRSQNASDLWPSTLCTKARRWRLDKVLFLQFDPAGRLRVHAIDCVPLV